MKYPMEVFVAIIGGLIVAGIATMLGYHEHGQHVFDAGAGLLAGTYILRRYSR